MAAPTFGPDLGFDLEAERLYRQLVGAHGSDVEKVAAVLAVSVEQFLDQVQPLIEAGVVSVSEGILGVEEPKAALSILVDHEASVVAESAKRLARLAGAVRYVTDASHRQAAPGTTLDAYVIHGPAPLELVESWVRESSGDLMFLRPDQWKMPTEPAMAAAFKEALAAGRRARCIYPVRAMHEARSVLTARAAAGEEIRLMPQVPTRMSIVGRGRALIPDMPGTSNLRATVLRDPGMVALMTHYFEELWDEAVALPVGDRTSNARHDARRLLLAELAQGARDEQIAESLGLGLRTVRRQVANLLVELGVETRFQAGVEAVRRGWL